MCIYGNISQVFIGEFCGKIRPKCTKNTHFTFLYVQINGELCFDFPEINQQLLRCAAKGLNLSKLFWEWTDHVSCPQLDGCIEITGESP